jgi:hypothetical protein
MAENVELSHMKHHFILHFLRRNKRKQNITGYIQKLTVPGIKVSVWVLHLTRGSQII